MTELETSFFMCLVALRRAGKPNLRSRIQKEIQSIRRKSKELKNRIPPKTELTEEAKAIFYSQWYYSGARLLTSIDGFNSAEKISERLQIPRITIKRVLEFLHSTGLCVEKNGQYKMGPQSTHLGTDSPLIARHHQNWRLKTIERANQISSHELIFTSPVSIATADIAKVKKVLMGAVEDCFKIIEPSSCEELACLNIDWFKV